ncbi:MAG: wbbL 5 [Planctomycetaceae bacterium]|nr:wbbL 5 [Planctomycetaceae bacterium]
MSLQRVAVVFDNQIRPDTTGVYCFRALSQFTRVVHVLPKDLMNVKPGEFDLFLNIDDGLQYTLPPDLHPCAWWVIDTHLSPEWAEEKGMAFDWLFAAQHDGAERLCRSGILTRWLPLACDPKIHRPHVVPKKWDVGFVGHNAPGPRDELLSLIQRSVPNHFIGQAYFEELAKIYSACRIGFNRSIINDVNMRVFETLGCGAMLVTNDLRDNGQEEILQSDRHVVTYGEDSELLDKLRFYLTHDKEREKIAQAGHMEVIARHTYLHRMQALLGTIEHDLAKTTVGGSSIPPVLEQPVPFSFDENQEGMSLDGTESSKRPEKENFYFEFSRSDVLELVPFQARRVLDIGCGGGRLGAQIRERQDAAVIGIELNPKAAALARGRLNQVFEADVEQPLFEFPPGSFDCIICDDVLEYLRDPAGVLSKIRKWLSPDACLIISIPNVRHHTVIASLLAGNWTYGSAGLLDADHVRFFTRREIEKLLYRQGFRLSQILSKPSADYAEWKRTSQPGEIRFGAFQISGLAQAEAEDFFAYQYLIVARPDLKTWIPGNKPDSLSSKCARNPGLTSIVLVTFNQIKFTLECIDSIRLRTDEPYELICVDNGSTDGTAPYLQSLENVEVIVNPVNQGFPRAANQGIQSARGEQILLLNNDTLVTTGWLRRMLNALHSSSRIGIVGPCSNNVSGPQQVVTTYQDINSLDGFAWDWGQRNSGQITELDRLVGFCLLFKREVLERIGLLDERFGMGCYEDDDFCRRALDAGFQCVVAVDAFVHHYGSRTFAGSGMDLGQILRENRRKFEEKWGSTSQPATAVVKHIEAEASIDRSEAIPETDRSFVTVPHRAGTLRVKRASSGGLLLTDAPVRLSLCMIVRDNESTIRPCLESIRPWVDEMVIVDTGSLDTTPEICREYGARVFEFPWIDDFSAARNASLKHAQGEWIFWMDSDDTISAKCGRELRELANTRHPENVLGYVMQVHCPRMSENGHADITVVDHIKLFPNRPELRFEHRIHEQILPAIRRLGGEVQFTEIHVVHSGSDHSVAGRQRKLERDFRLLDLDLKDKPDHPFVLFNLGMTHADCHQHTAAVHYLQRCLDVSHTDESHVAKTYALLVSSLVCLDQDASARQVCQQARKLFPEDKELLFRQAMLAHQTNRLSEAVQLYHQVLTPMESRRFLSVDMDLAGYKARHNLALVYEDLGMFGEAEAQWRTIVRENPRIVSAQVGLAECLLKQNRSVDAEVIITGFQLRPETSTEGFRLESKRVEMQGDLHTSMSVLQRGLQKCGEKVELLREMARLQYRSRNLTAASDTLRRLSELAAEDKSVWNNLGVVLTELHQHQPAELAFRRVQELSRHRVAVPGAIAGTVSQPNSE